MYPTSTKFLTHAKLSSKRIAVVDVYEVGASAPIFTSLPISQGTITMDRVAQHRRVANIDIPDPSITDQFRLGAIDPRTVEFRISSGIVFPDGSSEFVPMGIYRIADISWREETGGVLNIDLVDRSLLLMRDTHAGVIPYLTWTVQQLIEQMVEHSTAALGVGINYSSELSNPHVPGGLVFDQSRLEAVSKLAEVVGADYFFDSMGDFQVTPKPKVDSGTSPLDAVMTIGPGEDGNLISANRGMRVRDVVNYIVVNGATGDDNLPVSGIAFDDNPSSPTWINGGMGISVKIVSNNKLETVDQCTVAAQAILKDSTGMAKSLDLQMVANPALEPGDLVIVQFLDGTRELHVINSIRFPLGRGQYTISTLTGPKDSF